MSRVRRGAAAAFVLLAFCIGSAGAMAHASSSSGPSVEAGRTWAVTTPPPPVTE